MSKLERARKNFDKAHGIVSGSAGVLLEYKRKVQAELDRIRENPRLTDVGKREAEAEARSKFAVEFLQASHTRKQEYLATVKKVIRDTDTIVYAPIPKPDATKLERFEAEFKELKTHLALSTKANTAMTRLQQFVSKIDDPYLASVVREQFADIMSPVLSSAGAEDSHRLTLAEMFDGLKSRFETEEARAARGLLDAAKSMEANPKIYALGGLAEESATQSFGKDYAKYLNDTDAFFSKHPEHKPADFVDQDTEQDGREVTKEAFVKSDLDNPTLKV